MIFWTWSELLDDLSKKLSEKTVLVNGDRRVTWKEYYERSNRVANALLDLGIRRQDKLIISTLFNKSIEFMEILYGGMKIATVPTYLNYRYVGKEVSYVINNVDAKFVFVQYELLPKILEVKDELTKVEKFIVIGGSEKTPEDMVKYEDLIAKKSSKEPSLDWDKPKPDDLAYFQYTTGTTGKPKGVLTTHKDSMLDAINSLSTAERLIGMKYDKLPVKVKEAYEKIGMHPNQLALTLSFRGLDTDVIPEAYKDERYYCLPPLITAAGIDHSLVMLSVGSTIYYPGGVSLDPHEVLKTIENEKITTLLVAGDAIALPIAEQLKKGGYDTSSLLKIYSIGMKFSKNLKKTLLTMIPNAIIVDMLSTTEAWYHSGNVSVPGEEPEEAFIPSTPLRTVLLGDDGNIVRPGEIGEIVVMRERKIYGYYKDPEKTAKTFKMIQMPFQAGKTLWVFTGDYGTYDEEGRIVLYGRAHEIITTGGLKVFAPEVALAIMKHPAVQDAAVVGTPHERWGEAVTAIVQVKEGMTLTEEELKNFLRGKIADFKIPKRIVFAKVPRDPMGKVPIQVAKKLAMEKLGLS